MLNPNVRARWHFLSTIHPLFLHAGSLPTVNGADEGQYGHIREDDVDHLKNEITMLRSDFRLNIIKQQLIEIDQLSLDDHTIEGLDRDLKILLEELDQTVDDKVLKYNDLESQGLTEALSCFPRLVALRDFLHHQEGPKSEFVSHSTTQLELEGSFDSRIFPPGVLSSVNTANASHEKAYSQSSIAEAAAHIRFPTNAITIETCRTVVSRFGLTLDKLLEDTVGSWPVDDQISDYTAQDVEAILYAHDFAATCTSLFSQMVNSTECGNLHQATLQLSGFKANELKMSIDHCQEEGSISAIFKRSFKKPAPVAFNLGHICSQRSRLTTSTQMLHVEFNSEEMWEYAESQIKGIDPQTYSGGDQHTLLSDLLTHDDRLTLMYRKLAGVLLATSMFQLSNSPWIEQHLSKETIFVPSPVPDNRRLRHWCPRVVCSLERDTNAERGGMAQSDTIAAFGVLVLELETDRTALWENSDCDWVSGEKSNQVRLARVLKSWEKNISDDYRGVARACLEFDSLVDNVTHPEIGTDKRGLAVVYKYILNPLFRHVMSNFGRLRPLFDGMIGPGRHLASIMSLSASNTAKRILFDDDDSPVRADDRVAGQKFLDDLKFFFNSIRNLHKTQGIGLTQLLSEKKIRIVVLDSGVDINDTKIKYAIKYGRINGSRSRSFVGRPDQWQDTHSHGTHIAKLLLDTAPRAEIFIGKICLGKMINDEFMPGIADAINWAVEEVDADIISLSFGFHEENELIDTAVDKAIHAGKLLFVAASNNGAISGRARPARHEGVICVHASDGKGNKGTMNPTPLLNSDNFSTLGVAIPSEWKRESVWKSGTSFATPIAAAFAADVLEYANYKCTSLTSRKWKLLHQKRGMQGILRQMAEQRDGYDFIHPGRLWNDWNAQGGLGDGAARIIEEIMGRI